MSDPDGAVARDTADKRTSLRGRLAGFLLATLLVGYVSGSWLGLFRQVGAEARTNGAPSLNEFGIAPPALATEAPSLTPTRTPGGPTDTVTDSPTITNTPLRSPTRTFTPTRTATSCIAGWQAG